MDMKTGVLCIVSICIVVLAIGILKKRARFLLNFVARAILGAVAIYYINIFFAGRGMDVFVGINPLSIITVGTLGTGGLGLLYGIGLCALYF